MIETSKQKSISNETHTSMTVCSYTHSFSYHDQTNRL